VHDVCAHLNMIQLDAVPSKSSVPGCEECLKIGSPWVHLRVCLTCGKVGCCDSSPNRHATRHAQETGHPIIHSLEPGEDWSYCYVDDVAFIVDFAPQQA
jgi:uncharacterized UBP type Zn finger protein